MESESKLETGDLFLQDFTCSQFSLILIFRQDLSPPSFQGGKIPGWVRADHIPQWNEEDETSTWGGEGVHHAVVGHSWTGQDENRMFLSFKGFTTGGVFCILYFVFAFLWFITALATLYLSLAFTMTNLRGQNCDFKSVFHSCDV